MSRHSFVHVSHPCTACPCIQTLPFPLLSLALFTLLTSALFLSNSFSLCHLYCTVHLFFIILSYVPSFFCCLLRLTSTQALSPEAISSLPIHTISPRIASVLTPQSLPPLSLPCPAHTHTLTAKAVCVPRTSVRLKGHKHLNLPANKSSLTSYVTRRCFSLRFLSISRRFPFLFHFYSGLCVQGKDVLHENSHS